MQRPYRERRYVCGDYMEVAIFPVYAKAKGRGKQRKPSSDAEPQKQGPENSDDTDVQDLVKKIELLSKLKDLLEIDILSPEEFETKAQQLFQSARGSSANDLQA